MSGLRRKYRVTETVTYIIRVDEGEDPEQYARDSRLRDFESVVSRKLDHIDTLSPGDS